MKGEEVLASTWLPALRDGLKRAGARRIADHEFACSFYGDLFRRKGTRASGPPPFSARDIDTDWEKQVLAAWWHEAARVDPKVTKPDAKVRARTPQLVQRALNNLSKSTFFAGLTEKALIWDLKQVGLYLNNPSLRAEIRARVCADIREDTRIVIGHSLGSVVAYEALCSLETSKVTTLVTLGSPLGIANLVFHKLNPLPVHGVGVRPPVDKWFNIADNGDVVALVKELKPLFPGLLNDVPVDNESRAHDVTAYLTAKQTGAAVASGLD